MDSSLKPMFAMTKKMRATCISYVFSGCGLFVGTAVNAGDFVNARQASGGTLSGTAPAGRQVVAQGDGAPLRVTVDGEGRYLFAALSMGSYTVTLMKGDMIVGTRNKVTVFPLGATEVDFPCEHNRCSAKR